MITIETTEKQEKSSASAPIVNDFSIVVGTKNGSGSQTSNLTIIRALFKMGIPVSGKNVFPSNIQGLPTWYTIRVNHEGYTARREAKEIVIAMNPDSFGADLAEVDPGGLFIYPDHLRYHIDRDDIQILAFPAKDLVRDAEVPSGLRDYVMNMAYVGVLAERIGLDLDAVHAALDFHFGGKQKPVDLNYKVIRMSAEWAAEQDLEPAPFRVEPLDLTEGYILSDGNTAAALGAVYGGVQLVTWYPITPASSLGEALDAYLPKLRVDPETGKNTFAVIQAEDELAAIGMAVGGGWAGLRAMTSTSGPGISLMTEYAGLAYYSETPIVVWDVQRMGPSTGLPTRTSQGDISQVFFLGHGDTQNILLLPGSLQECFEFGWRAFDLAETLQMPVYVLSDLDLGMNTWMTRPFEYPDEAMRRGKVLWEEDLEKLTERWGRYKDVDGDGIPYRTIPGNKHPAAAWFGRGTGHDEYARYTEAPDDWDRNMNRLLRKYETARGLTPEPEIDRVEGAGIGIVAFGSTGPAVDEARDRLEKSGTPTSYMRLRSLPFNTMEREFILSHERIYVIEMNHTGQMHQIMTVEFPDLAWKLVSLTHNNGLPLTARWIVESIEGKEGE
ncbi:MAG TPA: 2-oxoacid:acceptor oxidoreductase subunit alpha [Anaerolineales bacterium]|nr:2-oxoacid:acceptor oxidoreductase subunit alpha [Anaerolineales bacterium]